MNNKKIIFLIACICFSFLLSLFTTYLYGVSFLHGRYWHGTIHAVSTIQVELLKNTLPKIVIEEKDAKSEVFFKTILAPLNRKLAIEVWNADTKVFSNHQSWPLDQSKGEAKIIGQGKLRYIVQHYLPPTWNYQFTSWLKSPSDWFKNSKNFITIPFLMFLTIYLMFVYMLAWRLKANYLESDVLKVINSLKHKEPIGEGD